MGKDLEVSDMPVLSDEMHVQLRTLERNLLEKLSHCCHSYDLRDPEAAFEYVRTYATKFFDCFYDFYSHSPDPQYHPHCRPAAEKLAYQRVMKCIENYTSVESFFRRSLDRPGRIRKTISNHAEQRSSTLVLYPPSRMERAVPPLTVTTPKVSQQLRKLLDECRMTAEQVAEQIRIDPRSVYRHLAGTSVPRPRQIASYEKAFSETLNKSIRIEMSGKRH
jgi:hypothetical protein